LKPQSAKAKGRRLQQWVAGKISEITGLPCGKDELIESREMGQSGTDVKLYGVASEMFPFSVESKYCEKWSMFAWIKQAMTNKNKNTDWLLVCKRNRMKPVVVMDAEVFFDFYEQLIKHVWEDTP